MQGARVTKRGARLIHPIFLYMVVPPPAHQHFARQLFLLSKTVGSWKKGRIGIWTNKGRGRGGWGGRARGRNRKG